MDTIGSKLFKYRKIRGMSRRSLADGICDISTLYRIEQDIQEPQLFTLRMLCKKLGISMNLILNVPEREEVIYINNMKQQCRKLVYEQKYEELEHLIEKIEEYINRINSTDLDFSHFIDWHKAIVIHEHKNDIQLAKLELLKLFPESRTFVTETEIGIANSLGYIYLELNEINKAFDLYSSIITAYGIFPIIEDKLLYVRVLYNFIYTQYQMENYENVIEFGIKLLDFLEFNHLKIMFAKVHHMLGITFERIDQLCEAEFHLKKSAEFFLIEDQLFNYLKSIRALAEIQFKAGKNDEGIMSLLIVKTKLLTLKDPKNLPQLVSDLESIYLFPKIIS